MLEHADGSDSPGVIINYNCDDFKCDNNLITKAADKNPNKWGKEIVGTKIPIISEEQARKEKPDYFFVLPWYFIKEFKIRERKYLEEGGKFIVPLPNFHLISFNSNDFT